MWFAIKQAKQAFNVEKMEPTVFPMTCKNFTL